MSKQAINGKAFEYVILAEFQNELKKHSQTEITETAAFTKAKECYFLLSETDKLSFATYARQAVLFFLDIEPLLLSDSGKSDLLQLEIVSDKEGQKGDVRDILFIRSSLNWEIGISAKNNHKALKHSRLSDSLDFGLKWLGVPCSKLYFEEIVPIFSNIREAKKRDKTTKWNEFGNKAELVYKPILNAFTKEMLRLEKEHTNFAHELVHYLIGKKDFYKVMKERNKIVLQAFNFEGSLNQASKLNKPKNKIPRLKLPKRLIELTYKDDSDNTLIASFDEGWQISFRIHSAKSTLEASLKFDINLVSAPSSLFNQHILIK